MSQYDVAHAFLYSNATSSTNEEIRTLARISLHELERLKAEAERAWGIAGGGRCQCGEVVTLTQDGRLTEHEDWGERCEWSGTRDHEPPNIRIAVEPPPTQIIAAAVAAAEHNGERVEAALRKLFRLPASAEPISR